VRQRPCPKPLAVCWSGPSSPVRGGCRKSLEIRYKPGRAIGWMHLWRNARLC